MAGKKPKAVGLYKDGSIYWIYPSVKIAAKKNHLAPVTVRSVIYGLFKLKSGIDFQYLDDKGARLSQKEINERKIKHSETVKRSIKKRKLNNC